MELYSKFTGILAIDSKFATLFANLLPYRPPVKRPSEPPICLLLPGRGTSRRSPRHGNRTSRYAQRLFSITPKSCHPAPPLRLSRPALGRPGQSGFPLARGLDGSPCGRKPAAQRPREGPKPSRQGSKQSRESSQRARESFPRARRSFPSAMRSFPRVRRTCIRLRRKFIRPLRNPARRLRRKKAGKASLTERPDSPSGASPTKT